MNRARWGSLLALLLMLAGAAIMVYPYLYAVGGSLKTRAEFAADNPVAWYKHFLQTTVLPRSTLFAELQAYGEVVVGLGLVLGLFTGLAALVGLVLSVNYGLATQWMSFGQQGFHLLLITSMVIFLVTGAGRLAGVDQLLRRWFGTRWWLRVLT